MTNDEKEEAGDDDAGPPRKGKRAADKAARSEALERATREEARQALLALGQDPDDEAAIQARLKGPPPPAWHMETIAQFCQSVGISESTYFREKVRGVAPEEHDIGGVIRISPEAKAAYLEARRVRKEHATSVEGLDEARQRRIAKAQKASAAAKAKRGRPSMYDPPAKKKPPKRGGGKLRAV